MAARRNAPEFYNAREGKPGRRSEGTREPSPAKPTFKRRSPGGLGAMLLGALAGLLVAGVFVGLTRARKP
jgi:hypothetical protein